MHVGRGVADEAGYDEEKHEDDVGDCDDDFCGGDCAKHGGDDTGFHDYDDKRLTGVPVMISRMLLVMTLFCKHDAPSLSSSSRCTPFSKGSPGRRFMAQE